MMLMRIIGCILLLTVTLVLPSVSFAEQTTEKGSSPGADPSLPASRDYLVGAGDQLGLEVWKDQTLTRTVIVLSDGKINIPLIGEVKAADRTLADIKKELEKRLTPFIPDPVLTLEVKQCNSLFVYVLGRVNTPGRFPVASNINVLQALAIAGGPNPFAKRNDIKIFRAENGRTRTIPFHYDDVTGGEQISDNIDLKRGDVIFVP
jgi:polysaccharide biosynthesis/export protein